MEHARRRLPNLADVKSACYRRLPIPNSAIFRSSWPSTTNALNFKKQQHSTIQLVPPLPLTPTPQKITKGNKISAVDWCINFHDRLHRCKHPGCERFESKSTCFSNKYTTTPHTSMLRLKHFTQTTHKPKRAHQPAGKLTLASCTTAVVLALGRISFGRRFSAASCATPSISSCCSLFQTGRRKTAATRPTALFSHLQQSRELCAFYTRNCCNFSNDQLAASSTVNEQIVHHLHIKNRWI
ncbi:Glycerol-3-phosphate acyltransferase [Trichinella spiralis]|uniref:Glycerol-3-phosphate acyltransferase n=1 Tax=Trichinella spiralis TaxID=6334 RepID=A0ABR3K3Q8_TRISP